jgi:uncharacterized tellurite resistance protein B-like protein
MLRCADSLDLNGCRFADDSRLRDELALEPAIQQFMELRETSRRRDALRTSLLASAVRVDPRVMPHLAAAIGALIDRLPGLGDVECYVFNDPSINAFVGEGATRTLVGLSSGAVNALDGDELRFVIGHELGHALFDHTGIDVESLATEGRLDPKTCMRLRAWQRAAEISADRAGLTLCDSLEVAAGALFKTVSGLSVADMVVRPEEFAGQWQHLAEEVVDRGERDHWAFSHPFPPLRMMAMLSHWRARGADATDQALAASEAEIAGMLAMMDPGASAEALDDPLLGGFFFWGGLYIALADGHLDPAEVERLQTVAPAGTDVAAVVAEPSFGDDACLARFAEGLASRRKKLSAVERHRIVYGLIDVAAADGRVDDAEIERLHRLGAGLGIPAPGCDLILGQYREDMSP